MRQSFAVLWARVAEKDLAGIIEYIASEDAGRALAVLNRIKRRAAGLEHMPKRGRIVPELRRQGISRFREIVVNPWRILYRIEGNTVYVVSVLDGRRNVEDILLERMLK